MNASPAAPFEVIQAKLFVGFTKAIFYVPGSEGGAQQQLLNLIRNNSDIALFAVAAGNGGQNTNLTTGLSAGVSRLAASEENVMAIGAVEPTGAAQYTEYGIVNRDAARPNYSNFGAALTVAAPARVPAMDKFGQTSFNGTSAANPHAAAVASLVWSANPQLNAGEVREILEQTATDLGAAGRDDSYGAGLLNADAAVRRASALARDGGTAQMWDAIFARRFVPASYSSFQMRAQLYAAMIPPSAVAGDPAPLEGLSAAASTLYIGLPLSVPFAGITSFDDASIADASIADASIADASITAAGRDAYFADLAVRRSPPTAASPAPRQSPAVHTADNDSAAAEDSWQEVNDLIESDLLSFCA